MANKWIDVTRPVEAGMAVWPGDDAPVIEQILFMDRGDICNLSKMAMSVHVGTHMDAPRHFINDGVSMDALPLDAVMGEARVVEIHDPVAIRPEELPDDISAGERILFKTRNSNELWSKPGFQEDFVYISREAAQILAAKGVRTVGVDYLSIGGFHTDMVETHEAILGAGIWAIEGLDLSQVEPGRYEMACLPMKLTGSDGAPARVALRRL
ncbi:MAG: cyclase family protein [Bryobacteraceae bacterium]|nr:cyclase family protein [Bryobacteraceae bacterium]